MFRSEVDTLIRGVRNWDLEEEFKDELSGEIVGWEMFLENMIQYKRNASRSKPQGTSLSEPEFHDQFETTIQQLTFSNKTSFVR